MASDSHATYSEECKCFGSDVCEECAPEMFGPAQLDCDEASDFTWEWD